MFILERLPHHSTAARVHRAKRTPLQTLAPCSQLHSTCIVATRSMRTIGSLESVGFAHAAFLVRASSIAGSFQEVEEVLGKTAFSVRTRLAI